MDRYKTSGPEGAYEPGSNNKVLANKLGIMDPAEMDQVEFELLEQLYIEILEGGLPHEQLTVDHIKRWHRRWLGNVYEWAGRERSVTMSKDGFAFAAAAQIPRLLKVFEKDCLAKYTPCLQLSKDNLAEAIAITHVEFILIHPFREGNGRIARLLADVMAVQAGSEPLDYSNWEESKEGYIQAIHRGMSMDYEPMTDLVTMAMG